MASSELRTRPIGGIDEPVHFVPKQVRRRIVNISVNNAPALYICRQDLDECKSGAGYYAKETESNQILRSNIHCVQNSHSGKSTQIMLLDTSAIKRSCYGVLYEV